MFNRDCEQAETWMAAREASLEDSAEGSGDSVESLLKKHEDFDRAISSQEEKIANLQQFADQLMQVAPAVNGFFNAAAAVVGAVVDVVTVTVSVACHISTQ